MFDAAKLLNQVLGGGSSSNSAIKKGKDFLGSNAGGLAAGGLAGYMLGSKKGRKMAKKAATYGGMALVAGLAYKAYNNYQQQKQAPVTNTPETSPAAAEPVPQIPANSNFYIEAKGDSSGFGATLVSAMIAAAKADGQIDGQEHQAIFAKIEELQLDNDEKAFLFDQLNKPMDIDSLVNAAGCQEQAVEIYVASLMAIEVDTPAEQAYLSMLAARLSLEPNLVQHIHSTLIAAAD